MNAVTVVAALTVDRDSRDGTDNCDDRDGTDNCDSREIVTVVIVER